MIMAVLTVFFVLSAIIILSAIKGAIAVDEKLQPIKEEKKEEKKEQVPAGSRSMTFLDFSKSRSIA